MSSDLQKKIAELKLKAQELREGTTQPLTRLNQAPLSSTEDQQEATPEPTGVIEDDGHSSDGMSVAAPEPDVQTGYSLETCEPPLTATDHSIAASDDQAENPYAVGAGCVVPGWGVAQPVADPGNSQAAEKPEVSQVQRNRGSKKVGIAGLVLGAGLMAAGMLGTMLWPSKPQPGGGVAANIEPPQAVVLAPVSSIQKAPIAASVQPRISSAKAAEQKPQKIETVVKPVVQHKKSEPTETKKTKKTAAKTKSIVVANAPAKSSPAAQVKPEFAWETVNLAGVGDVKTRVVGNETVIKVPASSKDAAVKVLAGSSKAQEDCGQGATCFRISNSDVSEQK